MGHLGGNLPGDAPPPTPAQPRGPTGSVVPTFASKVEGIVTSLGLSIMGMNGTTKAPTSPGLLGAAPAAPPSAKKTYYIENLPPLLDKLGFVIGASFMRFWQTEGAFQRSDARPYTHRSRVLDHDELKAWVHTKNYPLDRLKAAQPWVGERKESVIRMLRQAWRTTTHSPTEMTFPDAIVFKPPPLTRVSSAGAHFNVPASDDADWADAVDAYSMYINSDGAGIWEFLSSAFDDFGFALGRYGWYYIPKGVVRFFPATPASNGVKATKDSLQVTIYQVGIFALDSYDFNGFQPLGLWDVDRGTVSAGGAEVAFVIIPSFIGKDCLFRAGMGSTYVENASFCNFRDRTGNGLDFLVYSDVKFFDVTPIAFSFDL